MENEVSKSKFKAKALEYFRKVEQTGTPVTITDRGRRVLRLIPYGVDDVEEAMRVLRGSVVKYDGPTDPVGSDEWESLQ